MPVRSVFQMDNDLMDLSADTSSSFLFSMTDVGDGSAVFENLLNDPRQMVPTSPNGFGAAYVEEYQKALNNFYGAESKRSSVSSGVTSLLDYDMGESDFNGDGFTVDQKETKQNILNLLKAPEFHFLNLEEFDSLIDFETGYNNDGKKNGDIDAIMADLEGLQIKPLATAAASIDTDMAYATQANLTGQFCGYSDAEILKLFNIKDNAPASFNGEFAPAIDKSIMAHGNISFDKIPQNEQRNSDSFSVASTDSDLSASERYIVNRKKSLLDSIERRPRRSNTRKAQRILGVNINSLSNNRTGGVGSPYGSPTKRPVTLDKTAAGDEIDNFDRLKKRRKSADLPVVEANAAVRLQQFIEGMRSPEPVVPAQESAPAETGLSQLRRAMEALEGSNINNQVAQDGGQNINKPYVGPSAISKTLKPAHINKKATHKRSPSNTAITSPKKKTSVYQNYLQKNVYSGRGISINRIVQRTVKPRKLSPEYLCATSVEIEKNHKLAQLENRNQKKMHNKKGMKNVADLFDRLSIVSDDKKQAKLATAFQQVNVKTNSVGGDGVFNSLVNRLKRIDLGDTEAEKKHDSLRAKITVLHNGSEEIGEI